MRNAKHTGADAAASIQALARSSYRNTTRPSDTANPLLTPISSDGQDVDPSSQQSSSASNSRGFSTSRSVSAAAYRPLEVGTNRDMTKHALDTTLLSLLYGPPGTGKSSLIAAMANHLRFDIYDLELTEVRSNSDLRRLLVSMSNRSILVVEDIDCTIKLKQRDEGEGNDKANSTEENKGEDKVTLSGLLNFVDGLWSTSGEERIIVFTTNYKERLDQALLRPGRMDMHIHMGYCTPEAFRILANNYHSIDYHSTYPEIEKLINEMKVTPAEVAEVLMRSDDTDIALHDLVDFLKTKLKDANEIRSEHKKANDNQVDEKKDDRDSDTK